MQESDPRGTDGREDGTGGKTGNPGEDRAYLQGEPPTQVDEEAVRAAGGADDDEHTDGPAAQA